jgi:hypothetical protein
MQKTESKFHPGKCANFRAKKFRWKHEFPTEGLFNSYVAGFQLGRPPNGRHPPRSGRLPAAWAKNFEEKTVTFLISLLRYLFL